MWDDFTLNFIANIASAILISLVGVFVAVVKPRRIFGALARSRNKWVKRKLVRLYAQALRGRSRETQMLILTMFAPIVLVAAALYFGNVMRGTHREIGSLGVEMKQLSAMMDVPVRSTSAIDVEATVRKVVVLQEAFVELKRKERFVSYIVAGCSWALVLAAFALLILWVPFACLRGVVEYELDRFSLRIQGLAVKEELAQLAVAEAHVKNEETLRNFLDIARGIADRHKVGSLVDRFDFWKA